MRSELWGLILAVLVAGCDDGSGDGEEPTAVSFVEIQERVIDASCAFAACHTGASPAGMMGLDGSDAHAQMLADSPMAGRPRVVPGDSAGSYLFEKLTKEMPAFGEQMPSTAPLDAERIELVRAWIDGGAPSE